MKKGLMIILFVGVLSSVLNAGDKYSDLTAEYFYGKNSNVSVDIRRVVASDSQTSPKVLTILSNDKDEVVKDNVMTNPSYIKR